MSGRYRQQLAAALTAFAADKHSLARSAFAGHEPVLMRLSMRGYGDCMLIA